jgi:hypothetical protein
MMSESPNAADGMQNTQPGGNLVREDLLDTLLPMNRKEQYFTGTVLPMIVCAKDLQHLGAFTTLCGCSIDPVRPEDVQFFTEYNLKESISGSDRERFKELPDAGDTPDVLIMIGKELIAIEAKMYDTVTAQTLGAQMDRQKSVVIDIIQSNLNLEKKKIHQVALLPRPVAENIRGKLNYPVVEWETVHSEYVDLLGDSYFLEVLRLALGRYKALQSKPSTAGANADAKISGQEIYDGYKNRLQKYRTMGRQSGLKDGGSLSDDIASGAWCNTLYEVAESSVPANSNWFTIEEFIRLVE